MARSFRRVVLLLGVGMAIPACGGGGGGAPAGNGTGGGNFGPDFDMLIRPDIGFIADKNVDDVFELFVADVHGNTIRNISGPLVNGGIVTTFVWSPDRRSIAFLADKDADEVYELYVILLLAGIGAVKVSGPMVAGGDILGFEWAPDSARLAYIADQDTDGVNELYTVLPDGTSRVKVSGTLTAGGDVASFVWQPTSANIAYIADQLTDETFELFNTSAAIGGPVLVSGVMVAGGDVTKVAWRSDGVRIAYLADKVTDQVFELFGVGGSGLFPFKVNPALPAGGNVTSFQWSPAGGSDTIAYLADQGLDERFELFAGTSMSAGSGAQLSPVIVAGGDIQGFKWAPNGSRIAYWGDLLADELLELFTILPGGTSNLKVSAAAPVAGGDVNFFFVWAPDSTRLLYSGDQDTDQVIELYSTPPAVAVSPVKVSGAIAPGASGVLFTSFDFSPDSSRVVYQAQQDSATASEIYSSPATTAVGNVKVSGPLLFPGAGINFAYFSFDSSHIYLLADTGSDDVFEQFVTLPTAATVVKLSGTLVAGGDVVTSRDRLGID